MLTHLVVSVLLAASPTHSGMARIASGSFAPLYAQPGEKIVRVHGFRLDTVPVSEAQFAAFLRLHPQWAAGRVSAVFADRGYLRNVGASSSKPVTQVSWYAARAYCSARSARLPTTNEWEYVALASESNRNAARTSTFRQRVLELAIKPRHDLRIGSGFRNVWGVRDMHGSLAEWTSDFQSIFAASDSRRPGEHDSSFTCASGAVDVGDAGDYAAFMRYAFRASAKGRMTASTLGFRCAMDV